jgi:hypothetical protein
MKKNDKWEGWVSDLGNNQTIHLFTWKIVSFFLWWQQQQSLRFNFVSRLVLHQFITSLERRENKKNQVRSQGVGSYSYNTAHTVWLLFERWMMFNAWNVLPKRCNHDCLPPPSWKQRARDYMKKKMEFLIFWIFPKSTETSRHVQIFSFFFFSSSYRRQSINISRIRKASRPTTGNPPPPLPVSPLYIMGHILNATSRAKNKTNKNGECGRTCFYKRQLAVSIW